MPTPADEAALKFNPLNSTKSRKKIVPGYLRPIVAEPEFKRKRPLMSQCISFEKYLTRPGYKKEDREVEGMKELRQKYKDEFTPPKQKNEDCSTVINKEKAWEYI